MIERKRTLLSTSVQFILVALVMLVYITPFIMTILYSFKTNSEMLRTSSLQLPSSLYWGNYEEAFSRLDYFQSFLNTFLITSVSVGIAILASSLAGYGIARGTSRRFGLLYMLFVAGLLIPAQATFVPTYIMGFKLQMINTFWGVILLYVGGIMPFGVFMMTGFMRTIPREIEQAAYIDGCGIWGIYWRIVLPLIKPAVVTLAVMRVLLIWNDFLIPKLFLQKRDLQTITVRIMGLFGQYRYSMNLAFSAIVLSCIPILIFFLLNQKYVEKGIVSGAIKG